MALKSGRVGIHPSQVDPITGMLLSGPGGTTDYTQLQNKPQIGGVTLTGNKSLSDLNIPTSLDALSDTDIDNPEVGQTLQYTSNGWENVFASISPVTPATLASLQDVMLTDLQDGDFISYDATEEKWVNVGEAPAPEYTDITVTLYGAVEDTISFTDAAGISHSEVFASGQSSKSVTFKINPSGSTSITFTSAVAKDPENLSNDYTKTVSVTSATTSIYVMPDNVLYWYGYESSNLGDLSTANGWTGNSGYGFVAPTRNTNNIYINPNSNNHSGVGTINAVNKSKFNFIAQGVTAAGGRYGVGCIFANKNLASSAIQDVIVDSTSLKKYSATNANNGIYLCLQGYNTIACYLHAMWYE